PPPLTGEVSPQATEGASTPCRRRASRGSGCTGEDHHLPPASSIALSSARLLGVRFLPALRGGSGSPNSPLRAAMRRPNSPMRMTVSPVSAVNVSDAIFTHALFANAALKISLVGVFVKGVQDAR